MPDIRKPFGEAVKKVLADHSLSERAAMIRTGLNHVTIGKMTDGIVPRSETVIRFARGFGLNVNEWLQLAGYDPIEAEPSTLTPIERLGQEYTKLAAQIEAAGKKPPELLDFIYAPDNTRGFGDVSEEDVDRILGEIREKAGI